MLLNISLKCPKTLLTDDVLNPAGIVLRHIRINTQRCQERREYVMSFVDLLRQLLARIRQIDKPGIGHSNVIALTEFLHSHADAALFESELIRDVDGTHHRELLRQKQDRFEIILG